MPALLGVVIFLLLFGLPVAALVAARRLPPPKRRPVRGDRSWELAQEFRLVGADFTEVQLAVQQGRTATPSRLQPAAHAFAKYALDVNALGRSGGRRLSRRTARLLLIAYAAAVVVALAVAVADHLWRVLVQSSTYLIFYPVMIVAFGRRRHRTSQAALDANAPAAEAGRGAGAAPPVAVRRKHD